MSADSKVLLRNLIITGFCLAVIVAALMAKSLDETTRKTVIGSALAYVVGLWTHSGRPRGDGSEGVGMGGATLPVICLAALILGACDAQMPRWSFHWPGEKHEQALSGGDYGVQSFLLADTIEFKLAAAPTCTTGRACMYALNTDGLLYTKDANELTLKLHAAQSYRTSASCAALSSPANGDVCYDTGLSVFRYYSGGWTTAPVNDSLVVHLAGSETITGAKTFNAAPVFAAGATASGATAFNLGGSSATFTTPTGTNTLSGNVAIPTTKTVTVGANVLIGSVADKLNAAMLAIASQAAGDLLVADTTTTFARKAKGTDGQYLTMVSGAVTWATVPLATVSGGGTGALGAATVYLTAPGQAPSATERYLTLVTRAANSRNLYCYLGTAPGGADTVAVTVRENASDQVLTCTITGAGTTCNDTSNGFASVAGDRLSIKAASSAGTAADITCAFELTAG